MYVPIGCGSGICGLISARDALGLTTAIVGVVSANANAYAQSFAAGKPGRDEDRRHARRRHGGARAGAAALEVIRSGAARIVEVTDREIEEAMRAYFSDTHQVAEGAGAAPLAALLKEGDRAGRRAAVILSGGNVDRAVYARVLDGGWT